MRVHEPGSVEVPLDSPLHGNVGDDHWRSEVENLVAESSPGVEDGCVERTGERALTIGTECKGIDTLLCLGSWRCIVSHGPRTCMSACIVFQFVVATMESLGVDRDGKGHVLA